MTRKLALHHDSHPSAAKCFGNIHKIAKNLLFRQYDYFCSLATSEGNWGPGSHQQAYRPTARRTVSKLLSRIVLKDCYPVLDRILMQFNQPYCLGGAAVRRPRHGRLAGLLPVVRSVLCDNGCRG